MPLHKKIKLTSDIVTAGLAMILKRNIFLEQNRTDKASQVSCFQACQDTQLSLMERPIATHKINLPMASLLLVDVFVGVSG